MILIDDKLISDEILEEKFICNLKECKGRCCEEGDAGAPLEDQEIAQLKVNFDKINPFLSEAGRKAIKQQGQLVFDAYFGWVTPTINGGLCAYGYKEKDGSIRCAIEQAYEKGIITWKKPISCHLYPIRIKKGKHTGTILLNYEPREDLCSAACALGKKEEVPVYKFLEKAITEKFGQEFFNALESAADYMKNKTEKKENT